MTDLNKLRAQLAAKQPSSQSTPGGPQTNDLSIETRADPENKRVLIRINKHVNMIALDPAQARSLVTNLLASCKDIGIIITQDVQWE